MQIPEKEKESLFFQNKKTERGREVKEENLMLDGYMMSKYGKFNQVKQMPNQTFEAVEQQFKGFDKTAGSLKAFAASEGKGNPNLAVNPAKLSPSTLSTQFLTLTCQLGKIRFCPTEQMFYFKTKKETSKETGKRNIFQMFRCKMNDKLYVKHKSGHDFIFSSKFNVSRKSGW